MNCGCDERLAFTLTEQFASGIFNPQFQTLDDGSGFNHVAECRAAVPHSEISGSGDTGIDDPVSMIPVSINPGGIGNGGNGGDNDGGEDGRQCCGTYPNRFEFLSHGGSRSCCGEVTYDTSKHDCCVDGFLGAIGLCATRRT